MNSSKIGNVHRRDVTLTSRPAEMNRQVARAKIRVPSKPPQAVSRLLAEHVGFFLSKRLVGPTLSASLASFA